MKRSQILFYILKIHSHLIKGEILVILISLEIDFNAKESYFRNDFRICQFTVITRCMKSGPHTVNMKGAFKSKPSREQFMGMSMCTTIHAGLVT